MLFSSLFGEMIPFDLRIFFKGVGTHPPTPCKCWVKSPNLPKGSPNLQESLGFSTYPPPLRTLQVMLLRSMAACLKLWITLPFALESFRFAPANPDCWQRGSEDFCCDQDMKVSTLGTGIIWYFFGGRFFLLKPFTRWWQLKYFLFSTRTLGNMNPFCQGG